MADKRRSQVWPWPMLLTNTATSDERLSLTCKTLVSWPNKGVVRASAAELDEEEGRRG